MTEPLDALIADLPPDLLAFAPVAVKPRADGWTVARQRGFVARLALCGCVTTAARAVGKSRAAAYALRARHDALSFAKAWDGALDMGEDMTIDRAIERSIEGETRPVHFRGRKVGEYVRHDDRIMLRVLGRMYRDAGSAPRPPSPTFDPLLDALF